MTEYWIYRATALVDETLIVKQYAASKAWLAQVPHWLVDRLEADVEASFVRAFRVEPDEAYWEVDTLHA